MPCFQNIGYSDITGNVYRKLCPLFAHERETGITYVLASRIFAGASQWYEQFYQSPYLLFQLANTLTNWYYQLFNPRKNVTIQMVQYRNYIKKADIIHLSETARSLSGLNVPSVSTYKHLPSPPPMSIGNWKTHTWIYLLFARREIIVILITGTSACYKPFTWMFLWWIYVVRLWIWLFCIV